MDGEARGEGGGRRTPLGRSVGVNGPPTLCSPSTHSPPPRHPPRPEPPVLGRQQHPGEAIPGRSPGERNEKPSQEGSHPGRTTVPLPPAKATSLHRLPLPFGSVPTCPTHQDSLSPSITANGRAAREGFPGAFSPQASAPSPEESQRQRPPSPERGRGAALTPASPSAHSPCPAGTPTLTNNRMRWGNASTTTSR